MCASPKNRTAKSDEGSTPLTMWKREGNDSLCFLLSSTPIQRVQLKQTPSDQINARLPLLHYLNNYLHLNIDEHTLPRNISCPLHTDNKPSMRLYTPLDRGGYCFSCGKAYNAISVHAQLQGISYYEAMQQLAKDLNITIDASPKKLKQDKTNELIEIITQSMSYIRQRPNLAQEFDRLTRDIHRALRTGDLTILEGDNDEF